MEIPATIVSSHGVVEPPVAAATAGVNHRPVESPVTTEASHSSAATLDPSIDMVTTMTRILQAQAEALTAHAKIRISHLYHASPAKKVTLSKMAMTNGSRNSDKELSL